ncbi:DUF397 domain-containing protein [Actinoplanes campanulatus]|uniref:DUF397 domain-containing protein n=1 Tax=Actinoplanes campanulatus TaxID=113559 RepID=UPI001944569F
MTDLSNLPWKKSTRSSGNGACVEVAITADGIYVRDTKDRTLPPAQVQLQGMGRVRRRRQGRRVRPLTLCTASPG